MRLSASRWVVLTALTLAVVACAESGEAARSASSEPMPPSRSTDAPRTGGLRAEVSSGCPSELPYHSPAADWDDLVDNPDQSGLVDTLVPGVPSTVLVCRYFSATSDAGNPSHPNSGLLFSEHRFDAETAKWLAESANVAPYTPNVGHAGCIAVLVAVDRVTAIVFAVPGRADVNLWYQDGSDDAAQTNGCSPLSNGPRTVTDGLVDFFTLLNSIAPRAPVVCRIDGPPTSQVPKGTGDGQSVCF